jgi:NAD(P)H dehydrogenase (quinone)
MADLAVTGSTGALGGRVARALADLGIEQRLIVRDAGRAPKLDGAEVREVQGGYADPAGFREALEGVGTLFLVSAEEAPDRVAQHRNAVEAAAAAGVERIVYTSFLGASADSTFLLGRDHWATEEAIRATAVGFTFLRDSFYMDFIPYFAGPDRVFRGPAGSGRLSPVSRDDIAAVAVGVLSTPGAHDGKIYGMTGPELFTLTEAAERLTAYTGEPLLLRRGDGRGGLGEPPPERRPRLDDRGLDQHLHGDRRGFARPVERRRRGGHRPGAADPRADA